MGRFTPVQVVLVVFGCGLILSSIFLDRIAEAWENFRYPNAVYWQQMRIVPAGGQTIDTPSPEMLVVRKAGALLTLFLRPADGATPQGLVRELCRRDGCVRSTSDRDDGNRAAATYRMRGASLQIVLMRLGEGGLWAEYRGEPDGVSAFDNVIEAVTAQLADRRTASAE